MILQYGLIKLGMCYYSRYYVLQNFGAYSGSIYTVKTSEGESMVQLLDGYIDLILQTVSLRERILISVRYIV